MQKAVLCLRKIDYRAVALRNMIPQKRRLRSRLNMEAAETAQFPWCPRGDSNSHTLASNRF